MHIIRSYRWGLSVLAYCTALAAAARAVAGTVQVIYTFPAGGSMPNVSHPFAIDRKGNLYGITDYGGAFGYGAVIELQPPSVPTGQWTEVILYSFSGNSTYTNVVLDLQGNVYGTVNFGGTSNPDLCPSGCGTVFRLSPPAAGQSAWSFITIYAFNGTDGASATGDMAIDAAGSIFGVTEFGGRDGNDGGVAFELRPPLAGGGMWKEFVLHNFLGGAFLKSGVSRDPESGALYGSWSLSPTAYNVYSLTPSADKIPPYHYTPIYKFEKCYGPGGITFSGGLVYAGIDYLGGCSRPTAGSIIRLAPAAAGEPWTPTTLYTFKGGADGAGPDGDVFVGASGDIYGVTSSGGSANCGDGCGTIYTLLPPATSGARWTEKQLFRFNGTSDGYGPYAGFLRAYGNRLYTTAGCSNASPSGVARSLGGGTALVVHPHMTLRPSP